MGHKAGTTDGARGWDEGSGIGTGREINRAQGFEYEIGFSRKSPQQKSVVIELCIRDNKRNGVFTAVQQAIMP